MTRSTPAELVPAAEQPGEETEFVKDYAGASWFADASSAGLPGIVVAIVLLPFVWVGSRLVRLARRR